MTFKPHEIDFMRTTDLGRLATIQPNGTPQVSPVGFAFNEELGTIDITGYRMSASQKFRNIAHNDKVAFVVDDIASRNPWRVRCLEIRGTAEQARIAVRRRRRRRAGHRDHPHHPAPHHQLRHRRHRNRAASTGPRQTQRLADLCRRGRRHLASFTHAEKAGIRLRGVRHRASRSQHYAPGRPPRCLSRSSGARWSTVSVRLSLCSFWRR